MFWRHLSTLTSALDFTTTQSLQVVVAAVVGQSQARDTLSMFYMSCIWNVCVVAAFFKHICRLHPGAASVSHNRLQLPRITETNYDLPHTQTSSTCAVVISSPFITQHMHPKKKEPSEGKWQMTVEIYVCSSALTIKNTKLLLLCFSNILWWISFLQCQKLEKI